MAANPTLVPELTPARPRVKLDGQPAKPAPAVESAGLLYERYYDRVFGYCLYHLGSREEAEDAAQTTFLWAFRGLRRGIVPRAEASWLFTIAQNACRARHRTRGRRRERELLSDPVTLAELSAAPSADTEDLMGLEDALRCMPELQRRAILLREWRGLSYKEIAEELELSGSAVETLIFRARRSLAELLAGRPAPKRARSYALDFGSIAAALKSFIGGGTAAKVAAGLATVVAATTLATGSTEQVGADRKAPSAPAQTTVAPSSAVKHLGRQPAPAASQRAKTKPKVTAQPPAQQAPVSTELSASGLGSQLEQTVEATTASLPLVSALTETVDQTLDSATGTVAPVADSLP